MAARRGERYLGPYEVLNSHPVYEHPSLKLREDRVRRRDGRESSIAVVSLPPTVVVLPLDDKGVVTLAWSFRYGLAEAGLEALGGAIESGETAEQAGLRALGDQAGLIAAEWIDMGPIQPATEVLHAPTQMFLARFLTPTRRSPDLSEELELAALPFEEAVYAVLRGQISHAPSCVLILKTQQFLAKKGKK